jgi:hypothetical protein
MRLETYSQAFIAIGKGDLVEVQGFTVTRDDAGGESEFSLGRRTFTRQQLGSVTFWCAAARGVWLPAWAFHDGNDPGPAELWRITGVHPRTGEWFAKSRPAWHASVTLRIADPWRSSRR